jgi:dynein heavy chain
MKGLMKTAGIEG